MIDVSKLSGKQVKFGATVTLVDEDTDEKIELPDRRPGRGRHRREAALDHLAAGARADRQDHVGDTVEVTTPNGSKSYEIVQVAFK